MLLGNPITMQVENLLTAFAVRAFLDYRPRGIFFCATNGIAYNVKEHHFLPKVSERYNYEQDYVERNVLSIVCFDQEDCR